MRSCQSETAVLKKPLGQDNRRNSGSKNTPVDRDGLSKKEFSLGYRKLTELAQIADADELVLKLANSRSGFVKCFEKQLKLDWIHRILEIFAIAVKAQTCVSTLRGLLLIVENNFLQRLSSLFGQYMIDDDQIKDEEQFINICLLTLSFLRSYITILQSSLGKCYPIIEIVKQVISKYSIEDDEVAKALEELDLVADTIKEERIKLRQLQTRTFEDSKTIEYDENIEPPENFRDLSLLPSPDDLNSEKQPFLRPNVEVGKFRDLDHFLDIQFRLLREDYIRPLREGIREYKAGITAGISFKKMKEIRLYRNVQVLRPVCTKFGISYELQFDNEPFQKVNWSVSKRLLHGSLVCLSDDDFETVVFATVKDRDPKDLYNGQIQVVFDNRAQVKQNTTYTMAETTAYLNDLPVKFSVCVNEGQDKLPTMYWLPKLHKRPYKARFIANSSSCTTTELSKLLTSCLTAIKSHVIRYCETVYETSNKNWFWSIKNSGEVLSKLKCRGFRATSLSTYDFSTLYTTLPHNLIKEKLLDLIEWTFKRALKNYGSLYLACNDRKAFFTSSDQSRYTLWSCQNVCDALSYLLDNIYIRFGTKLYRQIVGIPMGTNCAPLVADLFLYCYERDFMDSLNHDNQADVIEAFNSTSRYLDDLLNIDNPYFEGMVNQIYPPELQLNKANISDTEAPFLDLHLSVANGFVSSKIYDKRDDFDFDIVNFPFLDGDVPRRASYGVYISQLIRFARVCNHVTDFNARNKCLTAKLLQQGYRYHKLRKTFSKFYRRHYELISKYNVGLKTLLSEGLSEPEFYGDLVYKLKKLKGINDFSLQFGKIISRYRRIGYNLNVMRQSACLVFNPIMVDNYAAFFNCTPVGRASDSMMAPT